MRQPVKVCWCGDNCVHYKLARTGNLQVLAKSRLVLTNGTDDVDKMCYIKPPMMCKCPLAACPVTIPHGKYRPLIFMEISLLFLGAIRHMQLTKRNNMPSQTGFAKLLKDPPHTEIRGAELTWAPTPVRRPEVISADSTSVTPHQSPRKSKF